MRQLISNISRSAMDVSLAAVLTGLTWGLSPAIAAPLEQAVCASLEKERKTLEDSGIRADIEKGPDWVKANLPQDRIDWVLRYIRVEDQIRFRCQSQEPPIPPLLPAPKPKEGLRFPAVKKGEHDKRARRTSRTKGAAKSAGKLKSGDWKKNALPQ